jgi:hypothetical protein
LVGAALGRLEMNFSRGLNIWCMGFTRLRRQLLKVQVELQQNSTHDFSLLRARVALLRLHDPSIAVLSLQSDLPMTP